MQNPLFIPGPTNIPERVRQAISVPPIDHRSEKFAQRLAAVLEGVKRIVRTEEGQVVLFPASGTGAWEAAITSTLSPGDKVLAARYGAFTDRWIELCRQHGLEVEVIDVPWGEVAPAEEFARVLAADTAGRIKAVLVCHNETSTGVTSDIAEIRNAMNDAGHGAMLFVDGVSSIASIDFRMDEWGVDVAVAGSQKGFMCPPGLAIVAIGARARAAMGGARCARAFFDIPTMMKNHAAGGFPYTPPPSLIDGLGTAIAMLEQEGLEAVYKRHRRLADGVRSAVKAWGLEFCAIAPSRRSDTVTAIRVPQGFDSSLLVQHAARKYSVSFGAGLGDVAGKVFRIGHLGAITDVALLSGIATAEMALVDLDYPIRLGSGVAAAQQHFRVTATSPAPTIWE